MKALTLTLMALTPLAAQAGTNLHCTEERGNVMFHLIDDRGGVATVGSIVTIVANGVLHTVIDARIDSVDISQEGKVVAELTTVNADGVEEKNSGKATLTVGILSRPDEQGNTSNGTAQIHLSKNPPRHPGNIVFLPDYELSSCKGTI